MKCKDCRAFVDVGKCKCGRRVYVCTEEPVEIVLNIENDWCSGLSFEHDSN